MRVKATGAGADAAFLDGRGHGAISDEGTTVVLAGERILVSVRMILDMHIQRIYGEFRMRNSVGKKPQPAQSETQRVWKRLRRDRPMSTISIRIPEDVIDDLKDIAPALGYSGYQPLIRAYIGRGLRKDLEKLDRSPGQALAESLRKRGMSDSMIAEVIAEAKVS
jgi:hypothetical protein